MDIIMTTNKNNIKIIIIVMCGHLLLLNLIVDWLICIHICVCITTLHICKTYTPCKQRYIYS